MVWMHGPNAVQNTIHLPKKYHILLIDSFFRFRKFLKQIQNLGRAFSRSTMTHLRSSQRSWANKKRILFRKTQKKHINIFLINLFFFFQFGNVLKINFKFGDAFGRSFTTPPLKKKTSFQRFWINKKWILFRNVQNKISMFFWLSSVLSI